MGKINVGRVFLGGLVAGAVVLACDVIIAVAIPTIIRMGDLPSPHIAPPSLGPGVVFAALALLVGGPAAIWFYAAIRPRFGPGPKTATYAALWIWLILGPYMQTEITAAGYPNAFPFAVWVVIDVISLPMLIVALLLGAKVYKEEEAGAAKPAAAGQ